MLHKCPCGKFFPGNKITLHKANCQDAKNAEFKEKLHVEMERFLEAKNNPDGVKVTKRHCVLNKKIKGALIGRAYNFLYRRGFNTCDVTVSFNDSRETISIQDKEGKVLASTSYYGNVRISRGKVK